MRLLFPLLLLLSLPLLLLSGLPKAEDANGKAGTANGTVNGTMHTTPPITSPTTSLGRPSKCRAGTGWDNCSEDLPFCGADITLMLADIFQQDAIHDYRTLGCVSATGYGCSKHINYKEVNPMYRCNCDSRRMRDCSHVLQTKLTAEAVEMYRVAHSTTPPPTTTPDPNHYCLVGADKKPCSAASFCHSKILLSVPTNKSGLGCVDVHPGEGLENGCRKTEHFNISVPFFECFCKSGVGHACNDLKRNKDRKIQWESESAGLLKMEKEDADKKQKEEMDQKIDNAKREGGGLDMKAYIGIIVGGCLLALFVSLVVGCIIYWKCRKTVAVVVKKNETDQDRQIRTDAQNSINAFNKLDAGTVMQMWYDFTGNDNKGGNAPANELIPNDVYDKDVIHIVNLPLVIASMVDPKLPDGKKMHWNFVNDEKTLIAAMCPNTKQLPHFFLSAVHLGVECIVQLTRRNEKTYDKHSDMAEYLPQCKTKLSFCKGTIGKMSIAVHVVDVEAKVKDETGKSVVHSIEHFQYFDWEDPNLPTERGGILDFTEEVFKYAMYENKCTLVHCRGGIGRTGAFLFCLTMLRRAFDGKQLTTEEVFGIAKSIRLRRCRAIQKPSQLAFAFYIAAYTLIQLADLPAEKLDLIKDFAVQCNNAIMDAHDKEKNKKEQEKAEKAKAEPPK